MGGKATVAGEHPPFFVYGTLRRGGRYHEACLGGRVVTGSGPEPAILPGASLFRGPGYPYAVPEPDRPDAFVRGELFRPLPGRDAEVREVLDRLEGYRPGAPDNLYEPVVARVLRPDGTAVRARLYVAAPALARRLRVEGERIPGGDWMADGVARIGPADASDGPAG
ncbi:gamma-glutamylcyclotransferase family protein [Streptomyces sp. ST2-7A]|uniref:gamma-glutamylcyclotransferase family protein n=1 Tax=Streptomyces sp. ST2-7A TaxID=2907214 RepID=UPI001F432653|nr:gamma-glutamylcyclotransferase family protein [Streptomyces sp. ST2-7A]MCE7082284.1 gamma-glutamylcyclotransferase [Streptomyces sp. ST2-7A]